MDEDIYSKVEHVVESQLGIPAGEIRTRHTRMRQYVDARSFTYLALSKILHLSWRDICREYGIPRRTFFYNVRTTLDLMRNNTSHRSKWEHIRDAVLQTGLTSV